MKDLGTEVIKKVIWLKDLFGDLKVIQKNIEVFCDNQSAIFFVKNQTYHARTKHIDVKYYHVREITKSGSVLLKKINTKDNPSDMLINIISRIKFQHCKKSNTFFIFHLKTPKNLLILFTLHMTLPTFKIVLRINIMQQSKWW